MSDKVAVMEAVRAFIAVRMDDKIRASVGKVVHQLKATGADVRWVAEGNYHITLKFLGNAETSKIGAIEKTLKKCLKGQSRLKLSIKGVGTMPNPQYPRIIYSAIDSGMGELRIINNCIEEKLLPLGFEKEQRDFFPHLTLGRVKSFKAKSLLIMKMRDYYKKDIGSMDVASLFLMKSELHPGGSTYTELAELPLANKGEK